MQACADRLQVEWYNQILLIRAATTNVVVLHPDAFMQNRVTANFPSGRIHSVIDIHRSRERRQKVLSHDVTARRLGAFAMHTSMVPLLMFSSPPLRGAGPDAGFRFCVSDF
jgi:hypothetical protein